VGLYECEKGFNLGFDCEKGFKLKKSLKKEWKSVEKK